MDNEPNRDLSHHEARDQLANHHRRSCTMSATELTLPNGKIADFAMVTNNGRIEIYEVKMEAKASLIAAAWEKYGPYCHRLWVAVPNLTVQAGLPTLWRLCDFPSSARVGLIGVHRDAYAIIKCADLRTMLSENQRLMLRCFTNKLPAGEAASLR